MGVSGTGKSTLGVALSKALCLPFIDGDDLHPQSNVDKMSRGEPLTDDDRQPWLETIRNTAVSSVLKRDEDKKPGIIIACSALKGSYRSVLRGETLSEAETSKHSGKLRTWFVYMKGSREVLMDRMTKRQGHFMKAAMLDSQLKTLENPENEEGVVTVSIEWSTEDQVREVVGALKDKDGSI
ncbi:P-loop containing nucleoside triphosphate hydrolase protein [Suillus paluster]|uniref:P-loop containing nucleoside triphosphate hydrolase protein n=1 Tax=Suillus paluster TaxID=48578 RepID=UPI001B85BD99|nr:P-loop containing nucleoside triphosphate hydrolase protein [Suillus paluster]KAG1751467.1 P-loop containing nucleoside triphosphate hydrolase protein [Suillus paluster]